jgi:hypothetical protein
MAATMLQLWNQSLGALGHTETIAAPDEVSRAAELCTLYYETARDSVFRAAPWPDLTGFKRLAQTSERDTDEDWVMTDPPPGWLYAHALPSDCVRPRFLSTWDHFEVSMVGDVQVIASNVELPILTYTRRIENPAAWDTDLYISVMYVLAAFIAKGITGNDSDLNNMVTLAREKILEARAIAANLNFKPVESIPDWLQARGQNLNMLGQRYIYPSSSLSIQAATVVSGG